MMRNKQYRLRMSDEELKELDRLSKKVGLNKADLIRRALVVFEAAYDMLKRHSKEIDIESGRLQNDNISTYTISLGGEDKNVKVLAYKNRGLDAREKFKLDELEDKYDKIIINIDPSILSFNGSYFIGLFGDSITKLKTEEEFRKKYEFKADEYVLADIKDNIKLLYIICDEGE